MEFTQIDWDAGLEEDLRQLVGLAVREDLADRGDATSTALFSPDLVGRAAVVARQPGVLAGSPAVPVILDQMDSRLRWIEQTPDGQVLSAGQTVGRIEGHARGVLAAERIVLNFLGRLSGIASLTKQYVDAVRGTGARIYDTRKTTPGWRRLEKYAVRCGGGRNHRTGLFDAVLIKDNHLAAAQSAGGTASPAALVERVRRAVGRAPGPGTGPMIVEVEVDSLEHLDAVLASRPDIVLLDNMLLGELREAVARRNAVAPGVQLEASGGITLATVREVAATGVERISVGALTHSAAAVDFGLDWLPL